MTQEATDTKVTYSGNCHCGRYRFTLESEPIDTVTSCTCRVCTKKGYLWRVLDDSTNFKVTRDDGYLKTYNSGVLEHRFCGFCGTGILGTHTQGPLAKQELVNVKSILDLNPFKLTKETPIVTSEPFTDAPVQAPFQHVGRCHCDKVHVELLFNLSDYEVKEDNCSSCVRSGLIGVYPPKQLVRITGKEHTSDYLLGRGWTGAPFCSTCGCHLFENIYGPPPEFIEAIPEERRAKATELIKKNMAMACINVRCLENVGDVKIEQSDEGTEGYRLD